MLKNYLFSIITRRDIIGFKAAQIKTDGSIVFIKYIIYWVIFILIIWRVFVANITRALIGQF